MDVKFIPGIETGEKKTHLHVAGAFSNHHLPDSFPGKMMKKNVPLGAQRLASDL